MKQVTCRSLGWVKIDLTKVRFGFSFCFLKLWYPLKSQWVSSLLIKMFERYLKRDQGSHHHFPSVNCFFLPTVTELQPHGNEWKSLRYTILAISDAVVAIKSIQPGNTKCIVPCLCNMFLKMQISYMMRSNLVIFFIKIYLVFCLPWTHLS